MVPDYLLTTLDIDIFPDLGDHYSTQENEKMGKVVYLGLCLLGCLILGSSSTPVEVANDDQVNPRSSCPPWAYQFRRNCYEYFPQPQPWYSAELNVHEIVHRAPQSKVLGCELSFGHVYYKWKQSLIWEWSDGSPYNSGSPLWDNRIPRSTLSSLECLLLINVRNLSDRSRWTEQNCDVSYPYVCKYKVDN
ncbi:PREDICTED: lithostathine-1-beta-like [Gekko japonicus]|uniref:Lithostathine-1-beta-like n=1 Tax=Gekko japonicus TaxID=146911 RepID=A0ABM1L5C2_GEKJA|nr:PREDICTED: lithostathine-1-beta-like [Gekko japonicus]